MKQKERTQQVEEDKQAIFTILHQSEKQGSSQNSSQDMSM